MHIVMVRSRQELYMIKNLQLFEVVSKLSKGRALVAAPKSS